MAHATCPNCGIDLARFDKIECGHLVILGNVAVYWKEHRITLRPSERLLLLALVRADGAMVPDHVLAEVMGYEGDDPGNNVKVLVSRIKANFRAIDPTFDAIERDGNPQWSRGFRWRAEAWIIPELRQATLKQRAMHKLMLEHPGCALTEWAALQGRAHSSFYSVLRTLEKRKLVRREKQYQRGWVAIGTLAMHAELEGR